MTQNLEAIRRFILAGQAIFTLVSKKSGERKTFRVRRSDDFTGGGSFGWFVDLLTGPNNTEDYRYVAFLWTTARANATQELHVKLNRQGYGKEAFEAFAWLVRMINGLTSISQETFENQAEFHHAGYCARCGRTLTDPESIDLGIGPVCRDRGML